MAKTVARREAGVKYWDNWWAVYFKGWADRGGDMGKKRGAVDGLSKASARNLMRVLDNPGEGVEPWVAFATLTYGAEWPHDGRVVKQHLRALRKRFGRGFGDELAAVWALEFQKRGAPHFMVLVNCFVPAKLVARWWNEIVDPTDLDHLAAGVQVQRPRGDMRAYFVKRYMAKGEQKIVPPDYEHPGRMWGTWGRLGKVVGEVAVSEAVAVKVKRQGRRAVESRSERRLPRGLREGRHAGVTVYRGGAYSAARVISWAQGEVDAGR